MFKHTRFNLIFLLGQAFFFFTTAMTFQISLTQLKAPKQPYKSLKCT